MIPILKFVVLAGGITAAVFWLWASLVSVPDNLDTFIAELQWISRLNSFGAAGASVASLAAIAMWSLGE